jgi:hypothetical protein
LVRFERSTLPDHRETRTVVLRVLKIFTPVKRAMPYYDSKIVHPKEGELHQKFPTFSRRAVVKAKVWSLNIDKKNVMVRGLQLLWDT